MTTQAFRPVDLAVAQATQPYFVWARYSLGVPRVYSLYEVPYGYNYLVRRVVSRWDALGATATDPPLGAEVFNNAENRARQNAPVPFALFSSPGGEAVAVVEAGAPLGISMTALPRLSARIVNLAFPYRDVVKLEITAGGAMPYGYLDLLLEGYLVPEGALAMWAPKKGAGRG